MASTDNTEFDLFALGGEETLLANDILDVETALNIEMFLTQAMDELRYYPDCFDLVRKNNDITPSNVITVNIKEE